jgi:AMP-binding enzyme
MADQARNLLSGRFVSAMTGSAPISTERKEFVESLLDIDLIEGYGSTEAGIVCIDGQVRRPSVVDYKLVDVPELGYFLTDQPYPSGELLVKTKDLFPGYFKRPEVTGEVFYPEGYYRTGDIVASPKTSHTSRRRSSSSTSPTCSCSTCYKVRRGNEPSVGHAVPLKAVESPSPAADLGRSLQKASSNARYNST